MRIHNTHTNTLKQFPGQGLNLVSSEFEVGVLITILQHIITAFIVSFKMVHMTSRFDFFCSMYLIISLLQRHWKAQTLCGKQEKSVKPVNIALRKEILPINNIDILTKPWLGNTLQKFIIHNYLTMPYTKCGTLHSLIQNKHDSPRYNATDIVTEVGPN
jgi:hypothetical protein